MKQVKHHIYTILAVSEDKSGPSWYFDIFLTSLIALNALAIVLQSVQELNTKYELVFETFELFSVAFFTLEYLLRIWTITESKKFQDPVSGRLRFVLSPMAIIDLLAIAPFYLAMMTVDLRFIRVLRLFRLFRLFKIVRYINALRIIENVIKEKREQLTVSIIFILFMLLIVSSVMYYVENPAQPEVFSSIPETMWWGVATLTTVGYGDVYPVTSLGKFLGGIISILGIGLFALPTGILASGFSEEIEKSKKPQQDSNCCPNCGVNLDTLQPLEKQNA